jgi:flagellar motility protein MotE (MotC chaperone)
MSDPLGLLALARAQILSEDVEEQLTARARDGYRPLVAILVKARHAAADAIAALVAADPANAEDIRRLQNEVRRFEDLVRFTQELLVEGREEQLEIADADRAELEELIFSPAADATAERLAEMRRLGLVPRFRSS